MMQTASHRSVSTRFQRLLDELKPGSAELSQVKRHISGIQIRLASSFEVVRVDVVGSHRKGTAVHLYSDVDLFVVLRRSEARWGTGEVSSTTVLRRVRDDLQSRYPSTSVRRDGVAAVVRFRRGDFSVDVVPGFFESFRERPVYRIPDGQGKWIRTVPDAQRAWLERANAASGYRLIPIVRMLKWWSGARDATAPLRSLYLETFLGTSNVVGGPWSHATALARAFTALAQAGCPSVRDPLGMFTTPIHVTRTDAQQRAVVDALRSAAERAEAALTAEARGNWREAVRQWSIIFNHTFPE